MTRWHQTFNIGHVPNSVVPKVFMGVACDLRDDRHGQIEKYYFLLRKKSAFLLAFILQQNLMLDIDSRVLALLLPTDIK